MKKSQFSESQRLAIVAKQDAGQRVEEICRDHQISPATFYKWKRELGDRQDDEKRRHRQLSPYRTEFVVQRLGSTSPYRIILVV